MGLVVSLAAVLGSAAGVQDALAQDRAALEKQFAESLSGVQFVGRYTTSNDPNEQPKRETYTIERVTKADGEHWTFVARIQYGERDVRLPLTLPVLWAGNTPVITLDKLTIPGLGTFSARVVIHGDSYAGTWDGGDHGGHLFGRIVKIKGQDP
jgi:hypothetical protein